MIDVRDAVGLADGIDVALQDVDDRRAALRFDPARHVEAVDVERLLAEPVGDFLASDDEKLLDRRRAAR